MRNKMALKSLLFAVVLLLAGCQGKEKQGMRMTGIEQMKNNDYAGALISFEQALELSKGKVSAFELDVLKYRAEAEYLLEDYEAAAHTYGILLQVDEERTEYYLYRSLAYASAAKLPEAISDYQVVAESVKETNDPDTAADLMVILQMMGGLAEQQPDHTETVMELYQQALDAGYASGDLYNRMGLLRLEADDYEGAVSLFEEGLAKESGEGRRDLLFNLAVTYERRSNFSKALEVFESYAAEFGADEVVQREITFLKTR